MTRGIPVLLALLAALSAGAANALESVRIGRLTLRHGAEMLEVRDLGLRWEGTAVLLETGRLGGRFAGLVPPPLALAARLAPDAGEAWLEIRVTGTPLRLVAEVETIDDGLSVFLDSGRIQVADLDLAALLPGLVRDLRLSGEVEAYGHLLLDAEGPRGGMELRIRNLALRGPAFAVTGLHLDLALDRPWPPRSLPGQRLTLHRIEAGVALRDMELLFALDGPRLHIAGGRARLAGGLVTLRPGAFRLWPPAGTLAVEMRGLDLARLVAAASLPDTEITGRADGSLVLVLDPHAGTRLEGRIATRPGGGVLRWHGELPADDPRLRPVIRLLRDFRYRRLAATLAGDPAGELELAVELLGDNPDVYGGRPVALRLRFTGPLGRVLRSGLASATLPARIQRALERGLAR